MTPEDALELIKEYAMFGRVYFEPHALKQMRRRGASKQDIFAVLDTAKSCLPEEEEKWMLSGVDVVGDDLTVIVSIEGQDVIVTVF